MMPVWPPEPCHEYWWLASTRLSTFAGTKATVGNLIEEILDLGKGSGHEDLVSPTSSLNAKVGNGGVVLGMVAIFTYEFPLARELCTGRSGSDHAEQLSILIEQALEAESPPISKPHA